MPLSIGFAAKDAIATSAKKAHAVVFAKFILSPKKSKAPSAPAAVLNFYENSRVEIDVPMPDMVEELVPGHHQDGRKVTVLDIDSAARAPEHLVTLANHVPDIAGRDREHLPPDGEAHPQAARKRNVPDVVEFLVTAADAHEEHLVDRVPPMSIEAHVELREFAHVVSDTALQIHSEGIRRHEGASDCKQHRLQNSKL